MTQSKISFHREARELRAGRRTRGERVLVSVGEASGDSMASAVVSHLAAPSFGLTGPELRSAGTQSLADVTEAAAIGMFDALRHAPTLAKALRAVMKQAEEERPRAALLVGFSELNARLGVRLRKQGTRVLWYAPPQVWAWRPERIHTLQRAADQMACVLPFEESIWTRAGVPARYVGHSSLETRLNTRQVARKRLQLTPYAEVVALLPGSRGAEVRRTLPAMLEAVAALREDRGAVDARLLLAPTLPDSVANWAAALSQRAGVASSQLPARNLLPAFDVAFVASGTATLECAVSGVPPVIVYRTGPVTQSIARRLLRVDHIGLPNLILGRRAFPELVQEALTGPALADATTTILDEPKAYRESLRQVATALRPEPKAVALGSSPSARVAALMRSWLSN